MRNLAVMLVMALGVCPFLAAGRQPTTLARPRQGLLAVDEEWDTLQAVSGIAYTAPTVSSDSESVVAEDAGSAKESGVKKGREGNQEASPEEGTEEVEEGHREGAAPGSGKLTPGVRRLAERKAATPSACNNQCDLNRALLTLVNAYRVSKSLPPLCLNNKLISAAKVQALYMNKTRQLTHEGPDGSHSADRVRRAGFAFRFVAENISLKHNTVEKVFAAWKGSSGTRANMLKTVNYTGAYKVGDYWVQVLAMSQKGKEVCNN